MDQSHGPYISCCSHQNQHNLPCFGSSNSSVATFSGEFQYDMASKQPAIIKVPDDDFLNSGPQNPVEAQSYASKFSVNSHKFHIYSKKKKKNIIRSWLLVGAFSTAHRAELCICTWGMHGFALNDLSKGH